MPALDTREIARRTVELLRDPARRLQFGEAGRAFAAEHFSIERMVQRVSDLYLGLLGRPTDHTPLDRGDHLDNDQPGESRSQAFTL